MKRILQILLVFIGVMISAQSFSQWSYLKRSDTLELIPYNPGTSIGVATHWWCYNRFMDKLYISYGVHDTSKTHSGYVYRNDTVYVFADTTGSYEFMNRDSLYFNYGCGLGGITGWYFSGDTLNIDTCFMEGDTTLWKLVTLGEGDFDENDFNGTDMLIYASQAIQNKSDYPVILTNTLTLQDTFYFPWSNPNEPVGLIVEADKSVDTVGLVYKAWLLWCDTLRTDSIYLLDPPFGNQAYELKYDPVTDLVYYYYSDVGGGGDTSLWVKINGHLEPKPPVDTIWVPIIRTDTIYRGDLIMEIDSHYVDLKFRSSSTPWKFLNGSLENNWYAYVKDDSPPHDYPDVVLSDTMVIYYNDGGHIDSTSHGGGNGTIDVINYYGDSVRYQNNSNIAIWDVTLDSLRIYGWHYDTTYTILPLTLDDQVYMTDSIYVNRYAIPSIKPGEPISNEVLVTRKLYPPLGYGQIARVPIDMLIDTLQYNGVNYWEYIESAEGPDTLTNDTAITGDVLVVRGASLVLPTTTTTDGQIRQGTTPIFHTHHEGSFTNLFLGDAGNFTLDSSYNIGIGFNTMKSFGSDCWSNVSLGNSALRVASGYTFQNIAIGHYALEYQDYVGENTAVGYMAGQYQLAGEATLLGWCAGRGSGGGSSYITAVGWGALYTDNSIGSTAVGNATLFGNTTGDYNTAMGYMSMRYNGTGEENTAMGSGSLEYNKTGSGNVAIGYFSMIGSNLDNPNVQTYNTAVGWKSLTGIRNGADFNTAIGANAGAASTTADANTFIGAYSGDYNTTGYGNTIVGYNSFSNPTNTTSYNNTAMGYDALVISGSYQTHSNTAIGYSAAASSMNGGSVSYQSYQNTFLGVQAGTQAANNTTSYIRGCIGIGNLALYRSGATAGGSPTYNIAIGEKAMGAPTSGTYTDGDYNIAIGNNTLQYVSGGDYNIYIGQNAGNANTSGDENIGIGKDALSNHTSMGGNTAVGTGSLISIPTGGNSSAFGAYALGSASSYFNDAFGAFALYDNTGDYSIGFGGSIMQQNTGDYVSGAGYSAGFYNTGDTTTLMGTIAANQNIGHRLNAFGAFSARKNIGNDAIAIGVRTLEYNGGIKNIAIGNDAFNTFNANTGAEKTFDYTDVNYTTDQITINAHGFGSTNDYVNLKFTQGSSTLPGMTDGQIYTFLIYDANTIEGKFTTISGQGTGTGHKMTPQYVYTNSIAIGYNSEPTKSNQIVLGNSTTIETLIYGCLLLTPQADPPSPASAGMIYSDTDGHIYHYDGSNWDQLDN